MSTKDLVMKLIINWFKGTSILSLKSPFADKFSHSKATSGVLVLVVNFVTDLLLHKVHDLQADRVIHWSIDSFINWVIHLQIHW